MQEYLDAASILSEARMMWSTCRKIYILVEGETDRLLLNSMWGKLPNVQIRVLGGWQLVNDTICLARGQAFAQLLGIIDKDYHSINKDGITENEQLLFTDANDIEMMLFASKAYDRFLCVCGSEAKLMVCADTRLPILKAAFPLGVLRALSLHRGYCFYFDGIECKDFVDRNKLSVDVDRLIEKIVQRTRSNGTKVIVANEEIKRAIAESCVGGNAWDYCNGHDVFDVLSIAMTKFYASASSNEYSPEAIFNYLLMGYTWGEFSKSLLCQKITKWFMDNGIETYLGGNEVDL